MPALSRSRFTIDCLRLLSSIPNRFVTILVHAQRISSKFRQALLGIDVTQEGLTTVNSQSSVGVTVG